MSKSLTCAGVLAGLLLAVPALAQTTSPAPTTPNSGAGVAGQPGSKNGPAPGSTNGVSGAAQTTGSATPGDTSKIPGMAGGKSGPAVKPPKP